MHIKELFDLTVWVEEKVVTSGFFENYIILGDYANSIHKPEEFDHIHIGNLELERFVHCVAKMAEEIDISELSHDKIKRLESFGLTMFFGEKGSNLIHEIYSRYQDEGSTYNFSKSFEGNLKLLSRGCGISQRLKDSLGSVLLDSELNSTQPELITQVRFHNNIAFDNISDFKSLGTMWFDIGRGIAMAHEKPPEDIKVVGARNGSIIIELSMSIEISITFSELIKAITESWQEILIIRYTYLKIKNEKIRNKLLLNVDNDSDIKSEIFDSIKDDVYKKAKLNNETEVAFERSLRKLIEFITKGGDIKFISNGTSESDKNNKEISMIKDNQVAINNNHQAINKLLIEHKKDLN